MIVYNISKFIMITEIDPVFKIYIQAPPSQAFRNIFDFIDCSDLCMIKPRPNLTQIKL